MTENKSVKALKCSDHLANERTFLAWIRTSIGIMAFGFVIERFSLFLRQVSYVLGAADIAIARIPSTFPGYSSILGIFVVGIGALIAVLSFIKYKKVAKQIDNDSYQTSLLLDVLLTLLVLLIGSFLVIYLIHTI